MKRVPTITDHALRNRAEKVLASQSVDNEDILEYLDEKRLLHELHVHKIELDM